VHEYHPAYQTDAELEDWGGVSTMCTWGDHLSSLAPTLKELRLHPAVSAQQQLEYMPHGELACGWARMRAAESPCWQSCLAGPGLPIGQACRLARPADCFMQSANLRRRIY